MPVMNITDDYYRLLGLDRDATPAQIKRAYHLRAKSAHPDAGGTEAEMRALNTAYDTLSDPHRRSLYDFDHRPSRPAPSAPPRPHQPQSPPAAGPVSASHTPGAAPSPHRYTAYHQLRRRQARQVAVNLLGRAMVTALAVNFLIVALWPYLKVSDPQLGLIRLIGFVPLYAIALATAYLIDPNLRLDVHDTAHSRSWRGYLQFLLLCLALGLPFLPLAWLWLEVVAPW
jgi:curved DNA-binding protein CbpA